MEELFAGVKEGVYIQDYKHGSGMSTFTIAPNVAYMIRDGKLAGKVIPIDYAKQVRRVMQSALPVDGLSRDAQLCSQSTGGCGKMEQWPLRVAFGGPYVRVQGISVQ